MGALLAYRLRIAFADLDRRSSNHSGDISCYINRFGYDEYARANVETFGSMLSERVEPHVVALSSGFMTYREGIHPEYARLRSDIERSHTTFLLIPSLDCDVCVAETVRRQLARPFARSAMREAAVIRERFSIYAGLCARKIETMRPPSAVVDEVLSSIETGVPTSNHPAPNQHACGGRN